MVVYTGHESKLLRNASSAPIKKSRLERMVNKQILAIFALLFLMATICVIGFVVWVRPLRHARGRYVALPVSRAPRCNRGGAFARIGGLGTIERKRGHVHVVPGAASVDRP